MCFGFRSDDKEGRVKQKEDETITGSAEWVNNSCTAMCITM